MTTVVVPRRLAVVAVRDTVLLGLALGCFGVLGGCKPSTGPRVPRGGDLDGYLAALETNENDLRAAGIYVSKAQPGRAEAEPPAGAAAGPPADPSADPSADSSTDSSTDGEAELDADAEPLPAPTPMEAPTDEAYAPAVAERQEVQARRRRSAAKEKRADGDRCERICDLAEMACELEARICEMADKHDGEPRYADACARAQLQCATAADACRTCE
jgi:hypothetical protein